MIDQIDLSDWSVKQLCQFHNSVIASGCNMNEHGYNYHYDDNDQIINQVKQQLIHMGACSNYVLQYEGKL